MVVALFIFIIALGIVIEILSLRRDPKKVEFEYTISTNTAEPGEVIKVQSIITNRSILPISYLAIIERYPLLAILPEGMIYRHEIGSVRLQNINRIGPRRRKKLTLETSINKRGAYTFRGDSLEFGDFIGLKEIIKEEKIIREIVIFPERSTCPDLNEALEKFCGDIVAKRYLIRDPILTAGAREYTGREPMREISWLQSARRGELMVKEFEYNRELSVSVLLDVEGISYLRKDDLDKCCSTARTVCETLAIKNTPISFFTNAHLTRKVEKDKIWRCEVSAGQMSSLLEGLGRVTIYERASLEHLLEHARRASDPDAMFIIITACDGEEDAITKFQSLTTRRAVIINMREDLSYEAVEDVA